MARPRVRTIPQKALPKRPRIAPLGTGPGEPASKTARVRAAVEAGDWIVALRIAKGLGNLGTDKAAIERAWEATCRPATVRQIGRDPETDVEQGKAVLRRRFGGEKP